MISDNIWWQRGYGCVIFRWDLYFKSVKCEFSTSHFQLLPVYYKMSNLHCVTMKNFSASNQLDADDIEGEENNGLLLNSYFIPEEIVAHILSFGHPRFLLRCRLVCKQWQMIVDDEVWKLKIRNAKNMKSLSKLSCAEKSRLKLPWYVYFAVFNKDPFEKNLLHNNCGQSEYDYVIKIYVCLSFFHPTYLSDVSQTGWSIGKLRLPLDGDMSWATVIGISKALPYIVSHYQRPKSSLRMKAVSLHLTCYVKSNSLFICGNLVFSM